MRLKLQNKSVNTVLHVMQTKLDSFLMMAGLDKLLPWEHLDTPKAIPAKCAQEEKLVKQIAIAGMSAMVPPVNTTSSIATPLSKKDKENSALLFFTLIKEDHIIEGPIL